MDLAGSTEGSVPGAPPLPSSSTPGAPEQFPSAVEVLEPGAMTTVQDYPGRLGYRSGGVPPSGPMDDLSFRLGNRAVGNAEGAAGLELTDRGPVLRFMLPATVCLAGAEMYASIDGEPVDFWEPLEMPAGSVLTVGALVGRGARAYLLFRGGLRVPEYLGSCSTFVPGRFGGHGGRALRAGDELRVGPGSEAASTGPIPWEMRPIIGGPWEIAVLDGPRSSPEFLTTADVQTFYGADWEVHHNSARTGVRLIGPKPGWARADGGEAGIHPSNIHYGACAVGSVAFACDTPVVLGPDGPCMGRSVCPATVVSTELWKLGQLKAGDSVRFLPAAPEWPVGADHARRSSIRNLYAEPVDLEVKIREGQPVAVLGRTASAPGGPQVTYRRSGDRNLLVEYGPPAFDLTLAARVRSLMEALRAIEPPGIVDLTPGVCCLQIQVDGWELTPERLQELLVELEPSLGPFEEVMVPSRIVHLPLCWEDPSTLEAIRRYMQFHRDDSPWCPGNLEFLRRTNGLESLGEVKDVVFGASYIVMGLGEAFPGSPVAVPLDPRHRLVATRYNPGRTWTPENVVGVGGAYLCVSGDEGPGDCQLVGRTVPVWNRPRSTPRFTEGKPWLLEFFDQIRFFPVTPAELIQWREAVANGTRELRIEPATFDLAAYRQFLEDNAGSIELFGDRQRAAFEAERLRWAASGGFVPVAGPDDPTDPDPDGTGLPAAP